jgi:hypothetical protein
MTHNAAAYCHQDIHGPTDRWFFYCLTCNAHGDKTTEAAARAAAAHHLVEEARAEDINRQLRAISAAYRDQLFRERIAADTDAALAARRNAR